MSNATRRATGDGRDHDRRDDDASGAAVAANAPIGATVAGAHATHMERGGDGRAEAPSDNARSGTPSAFAVTIDERAAGVELLRRIV